MVVLRGVLEKSFGSFLCLRGFASLKDLAECSEADPNYQRPKDDSHTNELNAFYNDVNNLFFPEIILGLSLQDVQAANRQEAFDAQVQWLFNDALLGRGSSRHPLGSLTVSIYAKKFKLESSTTIHNTCSIYGLDQSDGKRVVKRIDGNHRLEGALALSDDLKSRLVPFCLVIFRDNGQRDARSAAFFRNINFKALPIKEEDNLRIILESKKSDGTYVFLDSELLNEDGAASFGREFYLSRLVLNRLMASLFAEAANRMEFRTVIIHVIRILMDEGKLADNDEDVADVIARGFIRMFVKIGIERDFDSLSVYEKIACAYHFVDSGGAVEDFYKWLCEYDLIRIQVRGEYVSGMVVDALARSLLDFYKKTHRQGPYKIFVAMPYVSHERVNDFNKLFREICEELSDRGKDGVRYELIPIMRFRGESQRIDQRLIDCVKNKCDLFVADITGNNKNVIFEIGLAEGARKPMLLIRQEEMPKEGAIFEEDMSAIRNSEPVPFDLDKLQWIPYKATGYYNSIKSILRNNLPVMVDGLRNVRGHGLKML